MAEALYYPYLSLPGSAWVNPALLYFDTLGVIAPKDPNPRLFDLRTRELIDCGLVQLRAPVSSSQARRADDQFVGMMIGLARSYRGSHRIEHLHVQKLAHTPLAAGLYEAGLIDRVDHDWIECAGWLADHIMSYLALGIALEADDTVSLITDAELPFVSMTGRRPDSARRSRQYRALCTLLPVSARVRARDLAEFKQQHGRLLKDFRLVIDQLAGDEDLDVRGDAMFDLRLREAAATRDELEAKLREANWLSSGMRIAVAAAPMAASLAEDARFSAAAGLLALAPAIQNERWVHREARRARAAPLAYAALAKVKFAS